MSSEPNTQRPQITLDTNVPRIKDVETLFPYEQKWRERYSKLRERGYELRPRFRPGWRPSWLKWDWLPAFIKYGLMNPYAREDSLPLAWGELIMDAERGRGDFVVMKIIEKSVHPQELDIARYLTELKDSRNHCVPVLDSFDAFDDPKRTIIVMPLLRRFDDPPFETVWEVVECLRQLFEGLQFMHEHHIAHRDCFLPNIMVDASPLYPKPFHPSNTKRRRDWKGPAKHISRTEHFIQTGKHVRYFFIDFGISKRYDRYDPVGGYPRELPIIPADKSVPEHQGARYNEPSDPFATDVYLLGNAIRERFIKHRESDKLAFLDNLVALMTQDDPRARPTIDEVVTLYSRLDLGQAELGARLIPGGKKRKGKVKAVKPPGLPAAAVALPDEPVKVPQ